MAQEAAGGGDDFTSVIGGGGGGGGSDEEELLEDELPEDVLEELQIGSTSPCAARQLACMLPLIGLPLP